jgi:hypothetical protein
VEERKLVAVWRKGKDRKFAAGTRLWMTSSGLFPAMLTILDLALTFIAIHCNSKTTVPSQHASRVSCRDAAGSFLGSNFKCTIWINGYAGFMSATWKAKLFYRIGSHLIKGPRLPSHPPPFYGTYSTVLLLLLLLQGHVGALDATVICTGMS